MAEPLKNGFGPEIPQRIARMIAGVHPKFAAESFLAAALQGYEPLALMARGWHIAHALRRHLPADFTGASEILIASLGPKLASPENNGMAPFLYLPHVLLVAAYGLDHVEPSLRAQYELTQRFTAEFSIRPFLERHPAITLARLAHWAEDASPHVRRLVSEGTRPRLPWAPRLRAFQADPKPVLVLLELLKDDPELYVRRSVANNLNDIGKDHPDTLVATARRWMRNASPERRWIVRHALRVAVKRGNQDALGILGYAGKPAGVVSRNPTVTPARVPVGGAVTVRVDIMNTSSQRHLVMADLVVHFVKARGQTRPKVFKLRALDLAPRTHASLAKSISLARLTTRVPHPGAHRVELLINGYATPLGSFDVFAPGA